jgi:hypothetical protein
MPPASLASLSLVAATLLVATPAHAGSEAEMHHERWRACLSRTFRIQAVLTAPDLAADAAFRACRSVEEAYLAALAGSPLLDDDDIARARPLLAGRIRAWLVGSRG